MHVLALLQRHPVLSFQSAGHPMYLVGIAPRQVKVLHGALLLRAVRVHPGGLAIQRLAELHHVGPRALKPAGLCGCVCFWALGLEVCGIHMYASRKG
jgi:hypothetical protein